jgi:hypothetical protein
MEKFHPLEHVIIIKINKLIAPPRINNEFLIETITNL